MNVNFNASRIPTQPIQVKTSKAERSESSQDGYAGETFCERVGYSMLAGAVGVAPVLGGLLLADVANSTPSDEVRQDCYYGAAATNVLSTAAVAIGAVVGGPLLCAGAVGLALSGAAASIYRWNQGH